MAWHLTGSFARPRGWRRRIVITLLIVLTTSVGWLMYQTRSANITAHADRFLSQLIGADVHIDSAHIGIDGVITLRGIDLQCPELSLADRRVFHADQVLIHQSMLRLMRGRFHVRRLIFSNPTFYITEDLNQGRYNFSWLTPKPPSAGPTTAHVHLPDLLIQGGQVRFGQINDGRYEELGTVRLHGKLAASQRNPHVYAFTLGHVGAFSAGQDDGKADDPDHPSQEVSLSQSPQAVSGSTSGSGGPVLRGWFDYDSGEVEASIDHFTLMPWQAATLPSRVRLWWDRFAPQGTITKANFSFTHQDGPRLELEVQDTQLTLPHTESAPRMADVAGRFVFDRRGLILSNLTGRTDDFSCVVDGRVKGFALDAALDLTVQTGVFKIPEIPGYMSVLPVKLQNMFTAITPSGQGRAQVTIRREEPSGPLKYQGTVQVMDVGLTYHRFPYPLNGLNGTLRFTDDLLEIVEMQGQGPSGAEFSLNGAVSPLSADAAVDLTVVAGHLPIDEWLHKAVPPRARKILDVFLDRRSQQRLLDLGLIQNPLHHHQRATQLQLLEARQKKTNLPKARAELETQIAQLRDALAVPVFELGGSTSATVKIERTYGRGQKFRAKATVPLGGLRMMFDELPYPVLITGGQVVITPDLVRVERVEGRGLTGGSGYVQGTIGMPRDGPDRPLVPDLRVVVQDVPCDELFRTSLPRRQRRVVEQMSLACRFDAQGSVFRDPQTDDIGYRVDATLLDGSAWPLGRDYRVDQINGLLTIHRGWIEINQLDGQHGPTHWSLSGTADWRGQEPSVELSVGAQSLVLDEDLLALLPADDPAGQRYRRLQEVYHLEGMIDARLQYTRGDPDTGDPRLLEGSRKPKRSKGSRESDRVERPGPEVLELAVDSGNSGFHGLTIQPHSLAFDLRGQRVELTQMTGTLAVLPDGIETRGCGGSFEAGHFMAQGRVAFAPRTSMNVTLDLEAQQFDDTARAVLPEAVTRLIDTMKFNGPYQIHGAKVTYQQPARPQDVKLFEVDAVVRLDGAAATVGVPFRDVNGALTVKAKSDGDSPWPKLDLRLDAQRVIAAGRTLAPLTLHLQSKQRADQLEILSLQGSCYGGMLLGDGKIQLGNQGGYQLDLVLKDVALDAFTHPPSGEKPRESSPLADQVLHRYGKGLLSANLTLEGSILDRATRRGRGELEIRNADLYDVPLAVATLQILNLSLPVSKAFDRAWAQYLIQDDWVYFDLIQFLAPTIEIIGSGTMRYSSLQLDLDMFTRNPTSPQFGPLSDLFTVFKDQLVSLRVTGTLNDPKPRMASFQGVRRSWGDVFGATRDTHTNR